MLAIDLTLETVMTDPRFFGLTSAMPVQRASYRAADGLPLGALGERADVVDAFGGPEAIATLPVGERPQRVDIYSGIRTAKSLMASAAAVCMSQRIDVSRLRAGEIPRIPILSLDLDKSRVIVDHITGTIMARPALRALLIGEPTSDSIMLRHPSGCPVEIAPVAGKRAGGALVARWLGGAIFDEAPRMLGADEGVVNIDDALAAAEGRILPGGQIFVIGSPYAPWGECFESVRKFWGKPSRYRVVIKAPAYTMNSEWWTAARISDLREKNPRAFKTDVMAEFADASSSAFTSEWVDAMMQPVGDVQAISTPIGLFDSSGGRGDALTYGAAIWAVRRDMFEYEGTPSEDGFGIILHLDANGMPTRKKGPLPKPFLHLFGFGAVTGKFRDELSFDDVMARVASHWRNLGVKRAIGDNYNAYPTIAACNKFGITFTPLTWSQESKISALAHAKNLARDSILSIDAGEHAEAVRRELVMLQEKVTAGGGVTIGARRGGHDDFCALVINACLFDSTGEFKGSPIRIDRGIYSDPPAHGNY